MKKNSFNQTVIFNIVSTVLLEGILILTAPVFSRLLGAENFGVVSVYNTWVSLLVIVLGFQTHSTIVMAKTQFPENEQNPYASSVLWFSTSLFAVFSVLVCIFSRSMSVLLKLPQLAVVLIVPHALGNFCTQFLKEKLTHDFRADINCGISVANSVMTAVISLLLVIWTPDEYNYMGRILGMTSVSVCMAVGTLIFFSGKGKTFYKNEYWAFCIPICLPLVLHGVSGIVLNQSDRLMLNAMMSPAAVGVYSLTYSFSNIMSMIWGSLNSSWVPFYYDFMRKQQYKELRTHARQYMELYTVLTLGFLLLSPDVFRIYAGREFWGGISLIPVFVVGVYFIFLYSFPANYEFYHRKTKAIAVATVLSGVINIVLNIYMIREKGIYGAAFATAISHGVQCGVHYIYAKRVNVQKRDFPYSTRFLLLPAILVCCVAGICIRIGYDYIVQRWVISVLIGVVELYRIIKRKALF